MSDWQDSFQPTTSAGDWQSSFQPNTYSQNVGNDFTAAQNQIAQKWQSSQTPGGLNPASAGVQMLSDAATGAYAPGIEAAKSAYHSLPDNITQPINNAASTASQAVQGAYQTGVNKLGETDTGKAIGDYLMNSPKLQAGMQETSDDAKALANLLTLGAGKAALGDASTVVGDAMYDSGEASSEAANKAYIQNLVRPKETPTQLAENAKNTVQIDGKNIYQPTPDEVRMAQTVGQIPGVGNSLTPQGNLSAIIAERDKEAQNLQATLSKNGAKVDISGSLQPNIDQAVQTATNNPLTVVREGAEAHQGAIDSMNKAILNNMSPDGTLSAAGLLQARKDFDQMLPPRTFTGTSDTVLGNTAKQLRRAMNKTIGEADPSAGVAESLQKQSTLYDASDNIAPKAAGEAATPFLRTIAQYSPHAVGGAIGVGMTDILAHTAPQAIPYVLGTALVGGTGYKAITSPATRKGLGFLMGGGQKELPESVAFRKKLNSFGGSGGQ
jgi:hypothetical protein